MQCHYARKYHKGAVFEQIFVLRFNQNCPVLVFYFYSWRYLRLRDVCSSIKKAGYYHDDIIPSGSIMFNYPMLFSSNMTLQSNQHFNLLLSHILTSRHMTLPSFSEKDFIYWLKQVNSRKIYVVFLCTIKNRLIYILI
jgi:hypothetical protein